MSSRTGGQTRYDTAALLALAAAGGRQVGAVVVASGEDAAQGIDALASNFLAGHLGAPVLLTQRDVLPAPTAAALATLLGTGASGATVHVMGGPSVVSEAVLTALGAGGARVVRVSGDDRYATAAAAAAIGAASVGSYSLLGGSPPGRVAIVASGSNPADGLSAGPLAYAAKVPLLLTQRDALPAVTLAALRSLGIAQVVVLGGAAVVSTRVLDALDAAGMGVVTVAGTTRYDTAAVLLALASAPAAPLAADGVGGFGLGFADAGEGYLVNGARFPDALASGPLAGGQLRPLFLTAAEGLSPETASVIRASAVRSITAIGQAGAVPDAVLDAASSAAA